MLAPLLIRSLQQSAGDSDAAEKVGKAARYAIKCSKTFAAPSLSSLLEALTQAFSIYHVTNPCAALQKLNPRFPCFIRRSCSHAPLLRISHPFPCSSSLQYPSVLFVVSEVVKTFGKDAGAEAALTVAVTSLVATSARVLRTFKYECPRAMQ